MESGPKSVSLLLFGAEPMGGVNGFGSGGRRSGPRESGSASVYDRPRPEPVRPGSVPAVARRPDRGRRPVRAVGADGAVLTPPDDNQPGGRRPKSWFSALALSTKPGFTIVFMGRST